MEAKESGASKGYGIGWESLPEWGQPKKKPNEY